MTEDVGTEVSNALFRELQPQLTRILSGNLQAPAWVIDDACQTAWGLLIERRDSVLPGSELGWLATTATRAALTLLRRERTVEACRALPAPVALANFRAAEPAHRLELRERLAEVRRLPVRQQRVVMLHGFGYEYEEIAAVTGQTRRTVARQLSLARRRLLRPVDD